MIVFKYLFFKTSNIKSSSCLNYCVATLQGWAGPWYSHRQNNIHGAVGLSGMPLFMGGRARHAACLSACPTSWPLLCSVAPTMAPAPLCVSHHQHPQQGVPTCLSTRGEQSRQDAKTLHNTVLRMRAHFMLWEQFIRRSLKTMRILVIRPLQGYGNTAPLSYPDICVRKPDYLHLPYNVVLSSPGQALCSLWEVPRALMLPRSCSWFS